MEPCFTAENSPGVEAPHLERLNTGWREYLSYNPELLDNPAAYEGAAAGYRAHWLKRLADAGLAQPPDAEESK
jgi:hypothetical protein